MQGHIIRPPTLSAGVVHAKRAPPRLNCRAHKADHDEPQSFGHKTSAAFLAAALVMSLTAAPFPAEARPTSLRQKREEASRLYQEQMMRMEQKLSDWEKTQQSKAAPGMGGFGSGSVSKFE